MRQEITHHAPHTGSYNDVISQCGKNITQQHCALDRLHSNSTLVHAKKEIRQIRSKWLR